MLKNKVPLQTKYARSLLRARDAEWGSVTAVWENILATALPPAPYHQIPLPFTYFTMDKIARCEGQRTPPSACPRKPSKPGRVKTWIWDYSVTSFPVSWFGFQSTPICYRLSLNQKGTFRSMSLWLKGSGHLSNYLEKDARVDMWSQVGAEAKSTHRDVCLAQAVI